MTREYHFFLSFIYFYIKPFQKLAGNIFLIIGTTAVIREPEYLVVRLVSISNTALDDSKYSRHEKSNRLNGGKICDLLRISMYNM